jgi:uncharacterized protein YprB with RNaseH-like and TPR domain
VNLTDRVRGVLKSGPLNGTAASAMPPAVAERERPSGALERDLVGEWCTRGDARCFVVERVVDGDAVHGRSRVRDIARRLSTHREYVPLLTGGAPCRWPYVFFDLETTGLSGGAGTYAFLVGCASFTDDGRFAIRQFLMTMPGDERAMLQAISSELDTAGALVSFNGKSFDVPVLETRYLFHRLEWAGAKVTHLDALHPSRQFWGEPARSVRPANDVRGQWSLGPGRAAVPAGPPRSNCSLIALEEQVLGAARRDDVAGFEVPARYFQFLRTGDARPLAAVLEHNRLDLLSLAGLTAQLLELLAAGPSGTQDAKEAFALGRVYRRAGLDRRAQEAFAQAFEMAEPGGSAGRRGAVRVGALYALALGDRRARRHTDAAVRWRALLEMPDCPSHLVREAAEALAIHHEHRVRDLPVARSFALQSLEREGSDGWREAVRRRLTRLDRKIEGTVGRTAVDPPFHRLWSQAGPGD